MVNKTNKTYKKNSHVQFSKRIVVAVTFCVTMLCVISIVLCYAGQDINSLTDVVKVYIQYAMVVFAAYSGNSAVEKWLTLRGPKITVSSYEKENKQFEQLQQE